MGPFAGHLVTIAVADSRAAVANRSLGSWDWDVPANQLFMCPNAADLFGVDRRRVAAGVPLEDVTRVIHPDDAPRVHSAFAEARDAGSRYRATYRVRRPDASVRRVHAFGGCTLDERGQPRRFGGVLVDITDLPIVEPESHFDVACDNLLRAREAALRAEDPILVRLCDDALRHMATVTVQTMSAFPS